MPTILGLLRMLCRRPWLPICHLVLLLAGSALPVRAQFVDATSGPLGDTGSGFGVAWGDYDNDGDLDLYLANYGQANKLFRNDGGGTFVDATSGPLGDTGQGTGVAWGDYDHDGDLDLYLANHAQANKLFRNDGGGTFVDATSGPLGDVGGGRSVAWGDCDTDGDLDLFLTNITSPSGSLSKLFRNDAGTFVDATTPALQTIVNSYGAAWADFDNDNDLDLYHASFTAVGSRLMANDKGDGALVTGLTHTVGADVGVAWGDFDNDGDLDLFTARYNQASKLYRNDSGPTATLLVDVSAMPSFAPVAGVGNSRAAAWGDYDKDGDLDLYLVRNNQANKLFRNDGGVAFVDVTAGPLGDTGSGQCVAWGDYDNDGDPDLYISNSGQANKLLRNDTPAGNHWLKIRLQGDTSGRAGIGARVGIRTAAGWQIREISGGSNYASQDAPEALFGLGSATVVDSIYVRWPIGTIQSVSPLPAVDQAITVVEPVYQPPFTDVTGAATGNSGVGVAWGDYDGDGDLDIFLSSFPCKLLRNDGGSTFTEVAGSPLAIPSASSAAWGDYDNDGDLDLAIAVFSGVNKLYRNDGAGSFTDMSASAAIGSGQTRSLIWGDYDGDGDIDLYMLNFDQGNRMFRNNGGAIFTDVTVSIGLQNTGGAWTAAFGDYDNDGDLDLFVPNGNSPGKLYRNDGGTFVVVPTGPSPRALGAAWGDYDNDGDLDLYSTMFGSTPPANALYRNDGGGVFVDVTAGPLFGSGFERSAAWGDYDNDGSLDLFVASEGYRSRLLRNYGGGTFVNRTSNQIDNVRDAVGAAWGDYDNDGDLDLFQASSSSKLYRNNNEVSGRHWLRVKLVGTVSNRAAIGARVQVVTGRTARIREISGGSGVMSQDGMVASFGLGAATVVNSVIVRWPSGIEQIVLPPPAVDQTITVVEPSFVGVDEAPVPPSGFELAPASPNPLEASTRISYSLPHPARVSLTIHDLQGRQVASLAEIDQPAGRHDMEWRGVDRDGGRVAAGVYFVRLTVQDAGGASTRVRKIVVAN